MNKVKYFFLVFFALFQANGIAQAGDIPLSEIKFKKAGAAAKSTKNCYQLTKDQT